MRYLSVCSGIESATVAVCGAVVCLALALGTSGTVREHARDAAAAERAALREAALALKPVLREHLRAELARRRVGLDFVITLALWQDADGFYPIEIKWTVYDATGKRLGQVRQENRMSWLPGPDNGTWAIAAAAAAGGVVRLLEGDAERGE